jgi:hypothetical protein
MLGLVPSGRPISSWLLERSLACVAQQIPDASVVELQARVKGRVWVRLCRGTGGCFGDMGDTLIGSGVTVVWEESCSSEEAARSMLSVIDAIAKRINEEADKTMAAKVRASRPRFG